MTASNNAVEYTQLLFQTTAQYLVSSSYMFRLQKVKPSSGRCSVAEQVQRIVQLVNYKVTSSQLGDGVVCYQKCAVFQL